MLICPGGGYWNLAWDLEGEEVAAWLNLPDMTGVLLKYRSAAGGHGFGVRRSHRLVSRWPERCAEPLRELGVVR